MLEPTPKYTLFWSRILWWKWYSK